MREHFLKNPECISHWHILFRLLCSTRIKTITFTYQTRHLMSMSAKKKTLVLGASENPARYSYLAIRRLLAHGHEVVAIGRKEGKVENVAILTEPVLMDDIHTITLYLNPANQKPYYDYIASLKPKRIIFNPGTENEELERKLAQVGTNTLEACTLVMLATGQY